MKLKPISEQVLVITGATSGIGLALARAFVKDAAVVLLDEPTAQLDAGTEAAVLAALADLARGRTVLTVTHRDAPLALHDRVVELHEGRVVSGVAG